MKKSMCGESCLEAAKESLGFLTDCGDPSAARAGPHRGPAKLKSLKRNDTGDLTFPKRAPLEALEVTNCEFMTSCRLYHLYRLMTIVRKIIFSALLSWIRTLMYLTVPSVLGCSSLCKEKCQEWIYVPLNFTWL